MNIVKLLNSNLEFEKLRLSNLTSQVFCNVELNCANLDAVGFDMDYTLGINVTISLLILHSPI